MNDLDAGFTLCSLILEDLGALGQFKRLERALEIAHALATLSGMHYSVASIPFEGYAIGWQIVREEEE
jgi:hypothetical protein